MAVLKCSVNIYFIALLCFSIVAAKNDKCERCMPIEDCPLFREIPEQKLKTAVVDFLCQNPQSENMNTPFGFSPVAKGDYICCPEENVWGIENPKNTEVSGNYKKPIQQQQYNDNFNNNNNSPQFDQNEHSAQYVDMDGINQNNDQDSDFNSKESGNNGGDTYEQSRFPNHHRHHPRPHFNGPDRRPGNNPPRNPSLMTHVNTPNFNNPTGNFPNFNGPNNNFPYFNGPSGNVPNYNVPNGNNGNGNGNSFGSGTNSGGQCAVALSLPPAPETGCCGLDVSADRPANPQNTYWNRPAPNPNQNVWSRPPQYPQQYNPWSPYSGRYTRSVENDTADISLDNRIAGGKETELEQFPWTVLLLTTFDYGDRKASFNCGGSIISTRYILTAAHCVYEEGARISDIEINLAEYDKRTFPQDCVKVPGEGRKCINNIVMKAEDATPHPEYDDKRLQNDIALIRLRGNAPYTNFIRPICLPPIDIDNPEYSDLRLAVAGWGRNGKYTSPVKQSTVVNLVPQRECSSAYPHLTRRHLCAAGHSGEDTCKGDSGGPLMMLYEGKYYVSGVVSGKRADAPCGTAVPSLYTNVYQYSDWIRSNIRN